MVMKGGLLVCLLASSVGFFISFFGGVFIGDTKLHIYCDGNHPEIIEIIEIAIVIMTELSRLSC